MIDTKALRSKILDLAIQGKLTEQLPEDGTAEELYQQIQEEKEKLIQKGKLKKEKPLPEISEEEIPFEIPENWKWVKLGDIATIFGGKRIPAGRSLTQENTGHKYIRVSEMKNRTVITDRLLFVPEDIYPSISQYIINKEDVYITVAGTIGRVGKIPAELDGANLTENADRIVFSNLDQNWLIFCLSSSEVQKQIELLTTSVAQPKLAIKRIQEFLLPLPPLSEQERIVEKIEQVFSVLDTIDALQARYADNRKALKSKLIDVAIQGKLTEQLPEDGTAEELYQQIQEEKQKLINAGKLKKEKPLPEIADEELTYHFPSNWIYTKLDKVSTQITDGEHKTPRRVKNYCGYYLLSARNIRNGFITLDDVDYVDNEEYAIISRRCNPKRGDVLISCSGSIGRCAVVEDDNQYVMVRSAALISPLRISSKYLMYVIQSNFVQKQIANKVKQTLQANLFQNAIKNLIIPLPPLSEQKRIVSTLNELLPLLE